jgi:hypothetical protein
VTYLLKARTVETEKQLLPANGSETTFVSRQRSQAGSRGNSPRPTVEALLETVFSTGDPCREVIRRTTGVRTRQLGAAIHREFEPGSRGIAIVTSRYQATTGEDMQAGKYLACALVICKVWKLAMTL